MKKKWSCSECDYDNGRRWNVERHIASIHYTGTPVMSTRFASKTNMGYVLRDSYNKSTESNLTQKYQKESETNLFAENYRFSNKILNIIMQFDKAMNMKEGLPKRLIMYDLMNQFNDLKATPVIGFPNVKPVHLNDFSTVHQDATKSHTSLTRLPLSSPPLSSGQRPKNTIKDESLRYDTLDQFLWQKRVDGVMKYYADKYRHRCINKSFKNSFE